MFAFTSASCIAQGGVGIWPGSIDPQGRAGVSAASSDVPRASVSNTVAPNVFSFLMFSHKLVRLVAVLSLGTNKKCLFQRRPVCPSDPQIHTQSFYQVYRKGCLT